MKDIANDEVEQYQRRLCLCIIGMTLLSNVNGQETSNKCLDKGQGVFEELRLLVPRNIIDRAHHVGKELVVKGKRVQSILCI